MRLALKIAALIDWHRQLATGVSAPVVLVSASDVLSPPLAQDAIKEKPGCRRSGSGLEPL